MHHATPALAALVLTSGAAHAVPVVEWTTPTTGTLDGVGVSLSRIGVPFLQTVDLRTDDYATFPSNDCENQVPVYDARFDWTATFAEPVEDLLVYLHGWRGIAAGPPQVTYAFSEPITIVSGLDQGTVVLNSVLVVPGTGFHSGIVRISGPLTQLDMSTNATTNSAQGVTFGQAPPLIPPPAITAQPQSIVVDSMTQAQFSVQGNFFSTVRWRRDGLTLADGPGISGATTTTLTIDATLADVGVYDCVLGGFGGNVISDPAVLAVRPGCVADLNEDGLLDLADVTLFVQSFLGNCD